MFVKRIVFVGVLLAGQGVCADQISDLQKTIADQTTILGYQQRSLSKSQQGVATYTARVDQYQKKLDADQAQLADAQRQYQAASSQQDKAQWNNQIQTLRQTISAPGSGDAFFLGQAKDILKIQQENVVAFQQQVQATQKTIDDAKKQLATLQAPQPAR